MRYFRFIIITLACMITACVYAKDAKYWIDLESPDTQCFHYGSVPTSAVQGDLDNDGVMDVVVGTTNEPAGYLGKCFILWGGTSYQELLEYSDVFRVVAIEDINSDGLKDILCTNIVFLNQGNRKFIADPYKGFPLAAKFADFNGDGILDFSTGGYWRNGSDGASYEFNIPASYFEIIDVNNDNKLDLICDSSYDEPHFFWYENMSDDPLFSDAHILDEENITVPLEVMDYDYDGDEDLLVIHQRKTGFFVNHDGILPITFTPLFDTDPEGFTPSLKVSDLDFDGDWDLFGYNYDEKRFFVVEQLGYRSLLFEFKWISDIVTLSYWGGYFLYQNDGKTYYYFRVLSYLGTGAKGGLYRTPINVQAENAVSYNWELFQ